MQRTAWLLVTALAATTATAVGSEQQCAMFKRIFTYDKSLRDSDKIIVLVVGQTNDSPDIADVAQAFRAKGMYPAPVTVDGLNADLTATLSPHSTVIYVMPGIDYNAVSAFASSRGFLSVSGDPSLAESGQVSVSVDMAGSPPQVVVNMPRLTSEGHELSSALLKLARVIR